LATFLTYATFGYIWVYVVEGFNQYGKIRTAGRRGVMRFKEWVFGKEGEPSTGWLEENAITVVPKNEEMQKTVCKMFAASQEQHLFKPSLQWEKTPPECQDAWKVVDGANRIEFLEWVRENMPKKMPLRILVRVCDDNLIGPRLAMISGMIGLTILY
jgi:hypothetical protein